MTTTMKSPQTRPDADHSSGQDAKAASHSLADSARAAGHEAAETLSAEAQKQGDAAKSAAADQVSDMAQALRRAAEELQSGSPQERTFGQIANSLADASDAIRGKDLGEIATDLTSFARRNPMVFLGGAALVGFAATRFARASAETPSATPPREASYATSGSGTQMPSHRNSSDATNETPAPSTTPRSTLGDY